MFFRLVFLEPYYRVEKVISKRTVLGTKNFKFLEPLSPPTLYPQIAVRAIIERNAFTTLISRKLIQNVTFGALTHNINNVLKKH